MKVVVAALGPECPAEKALRLEGIEAEVVHLDGSYGYGGLFDRLWVERETFVLLEHDVVPWPGAVAALSSCEHPWCVHEYHRAPGNLIWALGAVKVAPEMMGYTIFSRIDWKVMDGAVVKALLSRQPEGPHVHGTPFAHCK